MKNKIILTTVVTMFAVLSAFACSRRECGGGNDKCCSMGSATYYTKASAPQLY